MGYPQFKTVAITAMFISVLFLTGCGKQTQVETTVSTDQPVVEQPQESTNDTTNSTESQPTTTPASTTITPNTTEKPDIQTTTKVYQSDFQSYNTPDGSEEVKVVATIDGQGIVKKVELAFTTNAPKSKIYQGLFSEGISAEVVGKNIKDVSVGDVNGSSLTSEGFNKAIDQIQKSYYGTAN